MYVGQYGWWFDYGFDFGSLSLILSLYSPYIVLLVIVWLYAILWDAVRHPLNQRVMPEFR